MTRISTLAAITGALEAAPLRTCIGPAAGPLHVASSKPYFEIMQKSVAPAMTAGLVEREIAGSLLSGLDTAEAADAQLDTALDAITEALDELTIVLSWEAERGAVEDYHGYSIKITCIDQKNGR